MQIEDLLPRLLPDVPGCPDITARNALLDAAIKFCVDSLAWNEIQEDAVVMRAGIGTYDIDAPASARVVTVMRAWAPAFELRPMSMSDVSSSLQNWQIIQGASPTYYNCSGDPASLRVFPVPSGDGLAIRLRVAYAPTLKATALPNALVERWYEALLSGARHRLMLTPGRAWSNPALAGFWRTEFDNAVTNARMQSEMSDEVQGSTRVRPRAFGY